MTDRDLLIIAAVSGVIGALAAIATALAPAFKAAAAARDRHRSRLVVMQRDTGRGLQVTVLFTPGQEGQQNASLAVSQAKRRFRRPGLLALFPGAVPRGAPVDLLKQGDDQLLLKMAERDGQASLSASFGVVAYDAPLRLSVFVGSSRRPAISRTVRIAT